MSICFLRRRGLGHASMLGGTGKGPGILSIMEAPTNVVRNDGKDYKKNGITLDNADYVVRWGCTSNIPNQNVLNTARAIHQVNDKLSFRQLCNGTDLAPATWIGWNEYWETFLGSLPHVYESLPVDVIVRPRVHSRGRNLHVCTSHSQLDEITALYGRGNYYISELIDKVAEYRVFVVQGRAVCVARKTPGNPGDIAWNVAQGGRFDNVRWDHWPLQAVRKAIEAFNLTDLDFGGVDMMIDQEGRAYVIEINSAPSLTSEYRQGCMAQAFDYIAVNGKQRIPLIEERGGYRKFIHPAVCARALLV